MSLASCSHVAPLGLGLFVCPVFYKHGAPLGLIGGRGSLARNWQWGTTIVVPYDSCCTHSLHERKNLTQGRYGAKVLIDLPLASLRLCIFAFIYHWEHFPTILSISSMSRRVSATAIRILRYCLTSSRLNAVPFLSFSHFSQTWCAPTS